MATEFQLLDIKYTCEARWSGLNRVAIVRQEKTWTGTPGGVKRTTEGRSSDRKIGGKIEDEQRWFVRLEGGPE